MRYPQQFLLFAWFVFGWVLGTEATAQFTQQAKLVGSGAVGKAHQGLGVSISGDGNTAIVGGLIDNSGVGAAWVFTRNGRTWRQDGNKLVGSGAVGKAGQGRSVSISSDGSTMITGGPGENGGIGAAWVFTRSGGLWTQQGDKLVGNGGFGAANQGISVSLSGDGNTAIVGGNGDNSYAGAAWVFTRSGSSWNQQGDKLVGTGAIGIAMQGSSVALSGDGNTAVVGGETDNGGVGAVWVFTRSGGVWSQQETKLVGTGYVGQSHQGISVSLSWNGNTAIEGGYTDNADSGATWVFTRSGGVWSQQGSKLVGTGAVGKAVQGASASLSGDGNIFIVGGYEDNTNAGAAWVFKQSGGVWSQQGTKLVGASAVGKAEQGISVSLSSDGTTAIVGGPLDDFDAGAAWVFTQFTTLPAAPLLVEPGNSSLSRVGTVTFKWHTPVQSGGRYWFELATDSLFEFKSVDSTLTDTVRSVNGLMETKRYWWRVCAYNSLGWGQFSDTWNFTVANAPSKVVLCLPPDRSLVPSTNVKLAWFKGSPLVDRFWYEIASDSLFTFKKMDSLVTDTSHVFSSLTNGTYWWRVRGHNAVGWGPFSSVWSFSVGATDVNYQSFIPDAYALAQSYPNPFNPNTTIKYELPTSAVVKLSVYDMLGCEVSVLVNERREAGVHEVKFDGSNLASGVYVYRLQAGDFVQSKRMLVLK